MKTDAHADSSLGFGTKPTCATEKQNPFKCSLEQSTKLKEDKIVPRYQTSVKETLLTSEPN